MALELGFIMGIIFVTPRGIPREFQMRKCEKSLEVDMWEGHKGATIHTGHGSYGGHEVCRHTFRANRVSPKCHSESPALRPEGLGNY